MEKKIINTLDNTPKQPSKFRTKNCIEINDDSCGMYNINSQIGFDISMLKSSVCAYSDGDILVNGTITISGGSADETDANIRTDKRKKGVLFKNCAPVNDCISKIRNIKTNFLHKLLLSNTQVSSLRRYFQNNSSANIELSESQ